MEMANKIKQGEEVVKPLEYSNKFWNQLLKIARLQDGWLEADCKSISVVSIHILLQLLPKIVDSNGMIEPGIGPTMDGGIDFNFFNKITGEIQDNKMICIYDMNSNVKEFDSIDNAAKYILQLLV